MLRVAAAAILLAALLAPAVTAEWASFHNDERNSGSQAGTAYKVYEEVWWNTKVNGTQVDASPVVKDGVMLIGSWDKKIRALDAESGKEKWNATMKGPIYGTPAIVAGRVFLVDSTGVLEARDLQKGTLLCDKCPTIGATRGSITTHEGKLFVGNEAGVMHAFDTETLTLLWKFTISNHAPNTTTTGSGTSASTVCGTKFSATNSQIRGAPAVFEGKVIFGSLNHWVFAVNEQGNSDQTTDAMWFFQTNDAIFGSPAIDASNDRALIGSYDEKVYALPTAPGGEGPVKTGTTTPVACSAWINDAAWTYTVTSTDGQSKVHSTPAIDSQRAYFGANNNHVYAVRLDNGEKVWDYATGGPVVSSPAVSNGIVVVGSDDAKVYWLDADDGEKKGEFLTDGSIKSSPALDGNRTFVASFEGALYMFGPAIPRRPDLQVTGLSNAADAIVITVRNTGDGKAEASKLRLTIDGSLAADLDVPAIEAGKSATVTHTVTLTAGAHTLVAIADQAGVVAESTENNNELSQTVTVEGASSSASGGGKKGGGINIPGPALPVTLAALASLAVLLRRRK